MRAPRVGGFVGAMVLVACSSASRSGDAGDAATPVDTAVTDTSAADGGGVCCPLTASPGCSPSGGFGGWAATASDCHPMTEYDGCPFVASTDDHGCAVLSEPPCSNQCGAVVHDAGSDAASNDPRCGAAYDSTMCGTACTTPGLVCRYPGMGAMTCPPSDAGDTVWGCLLP